MTDARRVGATLYFAILYEVSCFHRGGSQSQSVSELLFFFFLIYLFCYGVQQSVDRIMRWCDRHRVRLSSRCPRHQKRKWDVFTSRFAHGQTLQRCFNGRFIGTCRPMIKISINSYLDVLLTGHTHTHTHTHTLRSSSFRTRYVWKRHHLRCVAKQCLVE